jgi:hypothetical protein
MKKIIAAFLTVFVLSFTACSGETETQPTETVTVTESPVVGPTVPETPPTPPSTSLAPETVAPEPNDLDAIFVQVLRENTNSWDNIPDADVVELANLMCDVWREGATFEEIGQILIDSGYPQNEAGFFIGAGTEAYCPEFSGNFA